MTSLRCAQSGSAKFGGFVCVATGVSAALQLSLARVLLLQGGTASTRAAGDMGRLFASGPYGLLFASMVGIFEPWQGDCEVHSDCARSSAAGTVDVLGTMTCSLCSWWVAFRLMLGHYEVFIFHPTRDSIV